MDTLQRELDGAVRGEVAFENVIRGIYATDASHYQIVPRCVVAPLDAEDCVASLRVAAAHGVPTTARGGGTSLSGQTQGPGVVVDLSRHMNRILEVNAEAGWARVEPGVVRDQLNDAVRPLGLQFAPDPATSSRACIGGMVGNNSSGTRSIRYGKTSDHLLSCRVALADGAVVSFGPLAKSEWRADRQGDLHRGMERIVNANREQIVARFPKVMRRVSGYALDALLGDPAQQPWNLSHLICGAEGTLGVLLEATVRLVPLPAATAVCAVHFAELLDSLRAVEPLLAYDPSAVELLDRALIQAAVTNPSSRALCDFVVDSPEAILLVEISADRRDEARQRIEAMVKDLRGRRIGTAYPIFSEPAEVDRAWKVRQLGLGLLTNEPQRRKAIAFVEDACVPVAHLAEYIERLTKVCDEYGVPYSMYAHASVGVIHIRPKLDLHVPDDVAKMKAIADRAFDMVVGYGGAWAGEHGDGIVRGEFIARFFGPQLYQAFREVKQLFDPQNLMNPGKLIDPPPMTSHLRYQTPHYAETTQQSDALALFQFREQGGLTRAVEQCNGVGACRQIGSGTMCPSYMATREEKDCTRGRANALRLAISGQLPTAAPSALADDGLHEVMKLCLGCKACKSECPNAVDVAKMKAEVLQHRYDTLGTPRGARIIGGMAARAASFTGPWAPLVNLVVRSWPMRLILERVTGIDRRRPAPRFARRSLASVLRRRKAQPGAGREVALYIDSYTNAYQPEVGLKAVELLERCGYRVTPAFAGDSQRARISKGLLHDAKRHGEQVLRRLDALARRGLPILCLEPSCASALADDLPDLIDDAALGRRVAQRVQLVEQFLYHEKVPLRATYPRLLIHGHCHQKALDGFRCVRAMLPEAELIDAGCCGMAGSFGYEHYDLSVRIAEDRLLPALRAREPEATVVASGFSCRHQILDLIGIMPKHFVEVVEPSGIQK